MAMDERSFDLVVIGAGPAGEKGAMTAAVFGKSVAIVEKEAQVGGAVANTGTLPSKTLRETALRFPDGRPVRCTEATCRCAAKPPWLI